MKRNNIKYYKVVEVNKEFDAKIKKTSTVLLGSGSIPREYKLKYIKGVPTVSPFQNGKVFAFGLYSQAIEHISNMDTASHIFEIWKVEVTNPTYTTRCFPLWLKSYRGISDGGQSLLDVDIQNYWSNIDRSEAYSTSKHSYICDSITLVKCLKRFKS